MLIVDPTMNYMQVIRCFSIWICVHSIFFFFFLNIKPLFTFKATEKKTNTHRKDNWYYKWMRITRNSILNCIFPFPHLKKSHHFIQLNLNRVCQVSRRKKKSHKHSQDNEWATVQYKKNFFWRVLAWCCSKIYKA